MWTFDGISLTMVPMRAISPQEQAVLRVLQLSVAALSGRQVAQMCGISPTSANRALKSLEKEGLANGARKGRSVLWSATPGSASALALPSDQAERVAVVITALPLELTAVTNVLVNTRRERVGDFWVWRGELAGESTHWSVYVAQAGQGNPGAAAVVGALVGPCNANVVAFAGIAAGLKPDDHKKGDVIVASRLHDPATGKQVVAEAGSELLGRDFTFQVSAPLLSLLRATIAGSEWTPVPSDPSYRPDAPHAYVGPIVASASVQSSPESPLLDAVKARYQDAYALDMESYGAAAGADVHGLPTLAVRGISDFIADKGEAGNDAFQPVAAGNAAQFLRHVLVNSHPDDFRGAPSVPVQPTAGGGGVVLSFELSDLLGGVRVWVERIGRESMARADAALKDVCEARANGGLATWANRRFHQPPKWLREDSSGDGWALVGAVASLVESAVAPQAFGRAAEVAATAGEPTMAAYFRMSALLQRIRVDAAKHDDQIRFAAAEWAREAPGAGLESLGPLPAFYGASFTDDAPAQKALAERSIAALGLPDRSGVLRGIAEQSPAVDFDDEIRDLVASSILRQLAEQMLMPNAADRFGVVTALSDSEQRGNPFTRDLADDAAKVAAWSLALRPDSEAAQLVAAQAALGELVALTGRPVNKVEFEVSKRAVAIEAQALAVRDAYRAWEIPAGMAVAVAGRARSMQGDSVGALHLLCAPPNGSATLEESRHPEVIRVAAFLAMATGNRDLALQLADHLGDSLEASLIRARVLDETPGMAAEVNAAQLEVLRQTEAAGQSAGGALLGITARFDSFTAEERAVIDASISRVYQRDAQLGEVLRARCALYGGDPAGALELIRAVNSHELAVMTRAEALVELGRVSEGVKLVFKESASRQDFALATEALRMAMRHEEVGLVREVAQWILAAGPSAAVQLEARYALRSVERFQRNWEAALQLTREIVSGFIAEDLPVPEVEYWREAEALYFLDRFTAAVEALVRAPSLSFVDRDQVLLLFSILRRAFGERRESDPAASANDLGGPAFELFIRAASQWAHDEQLAAMALGIGMTARHANLTTAQQVQLREVSEKYFDTFGDAGAFKRVTFSEGDLSELYDVLRANAEANAGRANAINELAKMVRHGRIPLAAFLGVLERNYTESLVRCDFGYYVAAEVPGLGVESAAAALNQTVVADVSALVVGPLSGIELRKLVAKFDEVLLPSESRDDIAKGRSALSLRSVGWMGWDPKEERPTITEVDDDTTSAWAEAADGLWESLAFLRISSPLAESEEAWMASVNLARESGCALWADDCALRALARSEGIPAFGTLDLVAASGGAEELSAAIESMRSGRVVDLPFTKSWLQYAIDSSYEHGSPFFSAIQRPYAWRDPRASFIEFQGLMRGRPADLDAPQIAGWAAAAANGLAQALPIGGQVGGVAALLTWTVVNADPFFEVLLAGGSAEDAASAPSAGHMLREIARVATVTRDNYYPNAPAIEPIIALLGRSLQSTVGATAAGRYMAALVGTLDGDLRREVFGAYLNTVQEE